MKKQERLIQDHPPPDHRLTLDGQTLRLLILEAVLEWQECLETKLAECTH